MRRRLRAASRLRLAVATAGVAALAGLLLVAVVRRPEVPLPDDAAAISAGAGRYARPLGAAIAFPAVAEDEAYLDAFLRTFTSMTPENAMKWEVVHPEADDWDFGDADALVEAARRTNKRVRGHPVVWDQQLPAWAARGDVGRTLRDHVSGLVARYRGRVAQWDVVNEPLEEDGSLTPNVWQKALGERWIDVAFAAARAADPEAELFLNEIAAERGRKLEGLIALAERLVRRRVPVDGIGLQNHTTSENFPTRRDLARAFAAFARLGLDVEITEMDVEGAEPAAYAAAARACAEAPNCTGLTVWGVTDRWSWRGAAKQPLLFDAAGRPKPALRSVTRALAADGS